MTHVLDTSAVLAYVRGENGADAVETILRQADHDSGERILLPFIVMMEVEYILLRELEFDEVEASLDMISSWPIEIVESTEVWRHGAAGVKARGKLSLADSWVASLALLNDAQLVHKDPEFDAVAGLKSEPLPYNRGSRA